MYQGRSIAGGRPLLYRYCLWPAGGDYDLPGVDRGRKKCQKQGGYLPNSVKDLAKILKRQRLNNSEEFPTRNWIQSAAENKEGIQETYEGLQQEQVFAEESRWYRGDSHIHTTMSDGHDTPKR